MKVSVIGSGSWGTALSQAIVDNGHELLLYARTEKARDEINIEHTNKRYFLQMHMHTCTVFLHQSLDLAL